MALKSLNQLRYLREALVALRRWWLRIVVGVSIGRRVSISFSAKLRPGRRGSIVIGSETLIAFKTLLYTTDFATGEVRPIKIGDRCFIGGGSTILPGVSIGDECIIGGGSVVFEDVPPRTIVGGNPAQILRDEIEVGPMGRMKGAHENTQRLYHGIITEDDDAPTLERTSSTARQIS